MFLKTVFRNWVIFFIWVLRIYKILLWFYYSIFFIRFLNWLNVMVWHSYYRLSILIYNIYYTKGWHIFCAAHTKRFYKKGWWEKIYSLDIFNKNVNIKFWIITFWLKRLFLLWVTWFIQTHISLFSRISPYPETWSTFVNLTDALLHHQKDHR